MHPEEDVFEFLINSWLQKLIHRSSFVRLGFGSKQNFLPFDMFCRKVISEVCITTLILLALYATDSALIFLAVRILRINFLEE